MSNIAVEITLIFSIFIIGLSVCYLVSVVLGIGFIIIANIALPTIIKLSRSPIFEISKA